MTASDVKPSIFRVASEYQTEQCCSISKIFPKGLEKFSHETANPISSNRSDSDGYASDGCRISVIIVVKSTYYTVE